LDGFLISSIEEGCKAVRPLGEISRLDCRQRGEFCFSQEVMVPKYERLYEAVWGAACK